MIRLTVLGLGKLVTGQLSMRTVGGPIALFGIANEAAEAGLGTYLFQMALISVTLGLMNLLPIPVLDGGHIVFALIEGGDAPPALAAAARGGQLGGGGRCSSRSWSSPSATTSSRSWG